jgi:hypothetical protein
MSESHKNNEVSKDKTDEIIERKVEIDKSIKLTKSERRAYKKHLYDCNEEERIERKNALNKIQDHERKKRLNEIKIKERRRKIKITEAILKSCSKGSKLSSVSNLTKYKESKKLGVYLIKHGKEKLGLEYIRSAIKYKEESYESINHSLLQDYCELYKLEEVVKNSLEARRVNI